MNINFLEKIHMHKVWGGDCPAVQANPVPPPSPLHLATLLIRNRTKQSYFFHKIISFISLILSHFQFCLNHCLNKIEFLLMAIHYLIDWINLVWLSRLSKELSLTTPVLAAPTQLKSKVTFSWLDPRIFQSLKISPSPRKVQSLKIALSVGTWRDLGKIKC